MLLLPNWARLLQSRSFRLGDRVCRLGVVLSVRKSCLQIKVKPSSAAAFADLWCDDCRWHPSGRWINPSRVIKLSASSLLTDRSELVNILSPAFQTLSKGAPEKVRFGLLAVSRSAPHAFLRHATWSKMADGAAIERQLAELEEPEKPYPEDCCGGGCAPCVWDTYYEELEAYEVKKDALLEAKAQLERGAELEKKSEESKEVIEVEDTKEQLEASADR